MIAVCGTHGKSSTTAMVAKMLIDAGKDPSVVVGTKMKELNGRNWRMGQSDFFVVEACEYRRSFLHIHPSIVLLTNVDGDHFDAYGTIEEYRRAFVDFISLLPENGQVVLHGADRDAQAVAARSKKTVVDADVFLDVVLGTPGAHMRQNAQLALALADVLSIDASVARTSLSTFSGTWRRMQVKGTMDQDIVVIDDYGHHPVEIKATLAAMKEAYAGRRIVCVFQPHTHDRTVKLYADFVTCFSDADVVIIPNIYVARSDIETRLVDVDAFVRDIAQGSHVQALNGNDLRMTEQFLRKEVLRPHDVVITMGAGDITTLSDALLGTSL